MTKQAVREDHDCRCIATSREGPDRVASRGPADRPLLGHHAGAQRAVTASVAEDLVAHRVHDSADSLPRQMVGRRPARRLRRSGSPSRRDAGAVTRASSAPTSSAQRVDDVGRHLRRRRRRAQRGQEPLEPGPERLRIARPATHGSVDHQCDHRRPSDPASVRTVDATRAAPRPWSARPDQGQVGRAGRRPDQGPARRTHRRAAGPAPCPAWLVTEPVHRRACSASAKDRCSPWEAWVRAGKPAEPHRELVAMWDRPR